LQMTLPGAPTIYYVDEVGLFGPTYYSGGKWEDDPYNRQPYPWLDASGTPFYTHLQSQTGQDNLLNYYTTLTSVRNSHPALRTGSFDTLLVDDTAKVYAYGRLLSDYSDAAVVIVNRAGTAQDVTVDVSGYLPTGASFTDALNGGTYTVDGSGLLTVTAVPGMNGAVLVAGAPLATPPAAVTDLTATAVTESSVDLSWSAAAGASSYDVYRSLVSGGGYEFVDNTTAITFSDTGVNVTTDYYYVVVSRDDTNLLASGNSNEVAATPAYTIGWANLQWPPSIDHTISAITRTGEIYGQIYIDGVTSTPGATPGLLAQVGFGSVGSTPDDNWTWEAMTFNVDSGNNDEFMGTLLPDTLGTYCYTTRYSGDGGHSWFYAVNGPDEGNTTCPGPFGVLTVVASADTTDPAAPSNLTLTGTTNSSISLAWDVHPNSDGDLFGFEVYRENVTVPGFVRVATIADPAAVAYTDTAVTTGETYNYYVVAFDDSYNRSVPSNTVQATAEPRFVSVTFTVGVPAYTPGTVYLVGDIPELGPWNPGLVPMTQVDATTWTYTMDILDGTQLQYKYTRGTWDKVESWGSIVSTNNRSVTISYGTDGTQLVDNTATDWGVGPDDEQAVQYWRDPIVVDYSPADGAVDVPLDTAVTVAWSVPMEPDTTFVVEGPDGPVAGTFAYDDVTQVVTFTPDADLADGTTYTVTVDGAVSVGVPGGDSGVLQAPVVFSFTTYVITPEERLAHLQDMVNGLVDDGLLAPHYGRILLRDLQRAERFLGRDHWVFDYVAAAQVRIFIQHVEVLVKLNRLPAAEGQMLIDEAWVLIGQLLNG
ncbi:MAG: Ig-like domain-containing protein, partial [Anaerolineae bacterium]